MKKNSIKKHLIFMCLFLLLFNETLSVMLKKNFLSYIDELFVLLFFFYSIICFLSRKKIFIVQIYLIIFIMLFSTIGIYSCYVNSNFVFSHVIISNFTSIKFWILLLAVTNVNISNENKQLIYSSLETVTKIVLFFAIVNIMFSSIFYKFSPFTISHRFNFISVISLFEQPGKYGWFMLFMAIYYYCCYQDSHNRKKLLWALVCVFFAFFSLRTKVIVGIMAVLLCSLLLNKKIKLSYILLIVVLIGIVFVVFKKSILRTRELYFSNNESEARVVLTNRSFDIMKDYFPIGVGFGKYGSNYARVFYSEFYYKYGFIDIYGLSPTRSNYATDTFWPSIIGETGFFGVTLYVVMIIIVLLYLKKSNVFSSCFAFFAFIQSICESFGEPAFVSSPQFFALAFIIGIALNEMINKEKEEAN